MRGTHSEGAASCGRPGPVLTLGRSSSRLQWSESHWKGVGTGAGMVAQAYCEGHGLDHGSRVCRSALHEHSSGIHLTCSRAGGITLAVTSVTSHNTAAACASDSSLEHDEKRGECPLCGPSVYPFL